MRLWLSSIAAVLLALAAVSARAQEIDDSDEAEVADVAAAGVAAPPKPASKRGPAIGERDLTPYFADGAARKARAALDAGKPAQALALLPKSTNDLPGRWLRAQALKAAGRCRDARPELEKLAELGGPLRDRAWLLAGNCAAELGDAASAEKLFRKVSQQSVEAGDAYLEAARMIARRLPARQAAPLIEDVLMPLLASGVRGDPAAAHLVCGDAFLAAGDKSRAREHFRTAFLDYPLSAAAASARERARRLGGGEAIEPGRQVVRAERLVEGSRWRQAAGEIAGLKLPSLCAGGCPGDRTPAGILKAALELLAPHALPQQHQPTPADVARGPVSPGDPLACRAKLAQGRAYRKLRQFANAKSALAPVALRCQDAEVRAKAIYILAEMHTRAGAPEAEPLWLALAHHLKTSSLADDALFAAAQIHRAAGDVRGERALLQQLVDEQPEGDLVGEALFQLFWTQWTAKKPLDGIRHLDELAVRPDPDGHSQERAHYWRARARLERLEGQTAEARAKADLAAMEDLLWLARERPLTYHGLLARSRLAELAPEREREIEDTEAKRVRELATREHRALRLGPLADDVHVFAAIEYLRLGQPKDAVRELSAVDRAKARAAGKNGQEGLTLVADLYFRAGDLRAAHNIVRTDLRGLLRHPATALAVRASLLAYPLAFRPEIDDVTSRSSVPADLLQALMREESALDPRAVSPAGALGLTQLMPATARQVAGRLKIRGYTTARLYEPAINIRIGGAYFGQLYASFKNPALALASYNAGPGNVRSWISQRGVMPLDAFVEEIPLEETRGYVKRCLRTFAAYRYLYGTGPSRVPHVGQQLAAN